MKDAGDPEGKIYRIWIGREEYFLVEFRNNEGNLYYDMQLPRSGLLIWHITERESNSTEDQKLCDLECPDGLYRDAGYPLGKIPDPLNGRDNLDFWAHDDTYRIAHGGNYGDATDVYDGVNYTAFGTKTNPGTFSNAFNISTGIEIYNIHREGNEMIFDCFIPPLPGKKPHLAPLIGMGFQRSNGYDMTHYIDFKKHVYLVNFGLGTGPNVLVTVSRDSLHVRELDSLNQYEINMMATASLSGGNGTGNSSLARENVTTEEFARVLGDYNVRPEDLGPGPSPSRIQRISLSTERPLPFVLRISQNHPNPFNGQTSIPFLLSAPGPVMLEVFNALGQKVLEHDHGYMDAGAHTIRLSGENLSSGMYFYRLRGAAISETKRFILIR
jgi:hypothetical protein